MVGDDDHGELVRAIFGVVSLGDRGHGLERCGPRQFYHAAQVRDGEQEPVVSSSLDGHRAACAGVGLARAVRGQRRDIAGDYSAGRDRVGLARRQCLREDILHDVGVPHGSHNLRRDDSEDGPRRNDAGDDRVILAGDLESRRGGDDNGRGPRCGADERTQLQVAIVEEVHLRLAPIAC